MFSENVTTKPAALAVPLGVVKHQLRIGEDEDAHDDYLRDTLIPAAVRHVENRCGLSLLTTIWELTYDRVATHRLWLPRGPAVSVSSIKYYTYDDTENDWASTNWKLDTAVGRIVPNYGVPWPTNLRTWSALKIAYTAGWTTIESIPPDITTAVLELCAHFFENPSAILTGSISKELELSFGDLLAEYDRNFVA